MCSMPARCRATSTVRFARPGEKLLALNGREYALDPEITAIADDNGVQSLGGVIGGEPTELHRGDDRGVRRGGAVRSGAHRGDRPPARNHQRRALSLRARHRPGIHRAGAGDRDAADPRSVRRRGVRGRRRRRRAGVAAQLYAARQSGRRGSAGWHVPLERSDEDPRSARLRGRDQQGGDLAGRRRRRGAATSSARPISSRRCCASRATTTSRRCRCRATPCRRARRSTPRRRRTELVRRTLAARGLTEAVTFSFIAAARGRAVRRRPGRSCAWSTRSAPISTRCGRRCCRTCSTAARRNADRGFPDVGAVRARAALPRRHARRPGERRRRACAPAGWARATGATGRARPIFTTPRPMRSPALAAAGAPAENIQVSGRPAGLVPPGPRRHVAARADGARRISASCTRRCSRRST